MFFPRPFIDWKIVAAWIDTEENISGSWCGGPRESRLFYPMILITQQEVRPLLELRAFLNSHGIHSTVTNPKRPHGSTNIEIIKMDSVRKVLLHIRPCLLTGKKRARVERALQLLDLKPLDPKLLQGTPRPDARAKYEAADVVSFLRKMAEAP